VIYVERCIVLNNEIGTNKNSKAVNANIPKSKAKATAGVAVSPMNQFLMIRVSHQ